MCLIGNKIAYFRENTGYNMTFRIWIKLSSRLNKCMYHMSGEEQSFIDCVWSLILVKSHQYTVEDFDFYQINDMLCFLVTS